MQPRPERPIDDVIVINASNKSQSRGSHGAFRYFGKLAPDVTGRVLDLAAELVPQHGEQFLVVDPMCGSGTTLIEASDRGWTSIGLDVNPVARLYAQVKTRTVDASRTFDLMEETLADLSADAQEVADAFGATRNADRWFTSEAQTTVAAIMRNIRRLPATRERDVLFAVLLSRLRRVYNASPRTGRIFYDPESATPPAQDYRMGVESTVKCLPTVDFDSRVEERDARSTGLDRGSAHIVFLHPPYFALYRYSSDVTRFEMEIGGFSRRETAKREIREGWKSGDPANLDGYLLDMRAVMEEASRVARPGGAVALTASNSTLGDQALPVIDGLADMGEQAGLTLRKHYERAAHFGSASYHRSARSDKVIQQDHVLLFQKVE